jgi:hypothetical protein
MTVSDISEEDKSNCFEHKAFCPECAHKQSVFTQKDNEPEYYTKIYTRCVMCPSWILFELPVN